MTYALTTNDPIDAPTNAPTKIADGGTRWNNEILAEFNGTDAHCFEGSTDLIDLIKTQTFTLYFAVDFDATSNGKYLLDCRISGNSKYFIINVLAANATTFSLRVLAKGDTGTDTCDTSVITHGGSLPYRTYICVRCDGTKLGIIVNDRATGETEEAAFWTHVGSQSLIAPCVIGARYNRASPWDGNFAGMWVADAYHDNATVDEFITYLGGRYGTPNS